MKNYDPCFSRGLTISKFFDSFSSPGPGSYDPKFIEKNSKNNDWMFRPKTSYKKEGNKNNQEQKKGTNLRNANYQPCDYYNVREKYINESKKPKIQQYSFPKASRFKYYDKKYKTNNNNEMKSINKKNKKVQKLFEEEKNNNIGDNKQNIINFKEEKTLKGDNAQNNKKINKKKLNKEDLEENDVPGVGRYNLRGSLKVPVVKFGTEKKGLSFNKIISPGPAKYNMREKEYGKTKIEYSIPKEVKKIPRPWTPGPGKYNPNYNTTKINALKYSFPKNPKLKYFYNSNPSPDKYNITTKFGENGKKITISPYGRPEIKYNGVPGPDKYSPDYKKLKKTEPKYVIGTSKRKALYNIEPSFPGPNKYSINDKFNSKRPKSPTWKIGTGKRPPLYMNNKTPGVGIYSLRKSYNEGPKYTFRKKFEFQNKETRPGVGQYNISKSSEIIMKQEPKWKIGKASRDYFLNKIRKGNPGPGMYSIPCSIVDVNDYTREKGNFDKNYRYV